MATKAPVSVGRNLAIYVAAICLAFIALEGWREFSLRGEAIGRAELETSNLARSLRQHADDTFELAETVVASLVQQLERNGTSRSSLEHLRGTMRAEIAETTRFRALFVFGPDGGTLSTSIEPAPPITNARDRAYFQYHATNSSTASFFGSPVRSKSSGSWIITVSRRFNAPDGSFGGVVLASIDSAYFSAFYSGFHVGKAGSVSLLSTAGIFYARMPYDETAIASDRSATPLFKDYLPVARSGAYHFVSSIDGVARISGYDQSRRYPVVVLAAVSTDEALGPWFQEAIRRGLWTLLLALVVALMGVRLAEQGKQRRRSEAEAAVHQAEFKMLAESVTDLVERFDVNGRRVYASPAMERMFGVPAAEMLGRQGRDMMHPDDRAAAIEAGGKLLRNESHQATVVYRTAPEMGPERWMESSFRSVPGIGDQPMSVVTVTRDVTERKTRELELEQQASHDGLTGIANRREFDATLERELLRARRDRTDLSLLLIDVDRFKMFNDSYGHPAGDAVLKAIAEVVRSRAKRPADLAARYGGEEFALLLPDTDAAGAAFLGREFCKQLQALGMVHERNVPFMVVTASVGVATISAGKEQDGAWLLAEADRALYAAKKAGRNRCVVAETEAPALRIVS